MGWGGYQIESRSKKRREGGRVAGTRVADSRASASAAGLKGSSLRCSHTAFPRRKFAQSVAKSGMVFQANSARAHTHTHNPAQRISAQVSPTYKTHLPTGDAMAIESGTSNWGRPRTSQVQQIRNGTCTYAYLANPTSTGSSRILLGGAAAHSNKYNVAYIFAILFAHSTVESPWLEIITPWQSQVGIERAARHSATHRPQVEGAGTEGKSKTDQQRNNQASGTTARTLSVSNCCRPRASNVQQIGRGTWHLARRVTRRNTTVGGRGGARRAGARRKEGPLAEPWFCGAGLSSQSVGHRKLVVAFGVHTLLSRVASPPWPSPSRARSSKADTLSAVHPDDVDLQIQRGQSEDTGTQVTPKKLARNAHKQVRHIPSCLLPGLSECSPGPCELLIDESLQSRCCSRRCSGEKEAHNRHDTLRVPQTSPVRSSPASRRKASFHFTRVAAGLDMAQ